MSFCVRCLLLTRSPPPHFSQLLWALSAAGLNLDSHYCWVCVAVLARILSQFMQIPTLIFDHLPQLREYTPDDVWSPWPAFSKNPVRSMWWECPYRPCLVLVISQPPPITLFLLCKSPLVQVVFGTEPSFILTSLFPYCNSSWKESVLTTLTPVCLVLKPPLAALSWVNLASVHAILCGSSHLHKRIWMFGQPVLSSSLVYFGVFWLHTRIRSRYNTLLPV